MTTTKVFIDSRVSDYDSLISQFAFGTEYLVLDASSDGIEQILSALSSQSGGYDSIQIISHGFSGSITIGSTVLNNATLPAYAAELAQIGAALHAGGDLLLYGCNVAQGADGQAFIDSIARMTGADVAASTDLTGAAALGGDWVLEAQTGAVETKAIASSAFASVLVVNSAPTISIPVTGVRLLKLLTLFIVFYCKQLRYIF